MFYKKLFTLCLVALILVTSVFFVGCSSSDRDKYQKEEGEGSGTLTGYDAVKNLLNMNISLWVQFIDGEDIGQWELDKTHANVEGRFERALSNAGITEVLDGTVKLYMVGSMENMSIFIVELINEQSAELICENASVLFESSMNVVTAKKRDNVVVAITHKEGVNVSETLSKIISAPQREDGMLTLEDVIDNMFKKDYQLHSPCVGSVISKAIISAGCQQIENNIISYFSSKGLDASPINGKLEFCGNLRTTEVLGSESVTVMRFKDEKSALWAAENAKFIFEGINAHTAKGIAAKVEGDIVIICEAIVESRAKSLLEMAMGTY